MIEVRNPVPGGVRDILVFEVFIPKEYFSDQRSDCLLINVKMRVNQKTNKPYVVYPCMKILKDDGSERFPSPYRFTSRRPNLRMNL
jgi:hypothetical protein